MSERSVLILDVVERTPSSDAHVDTSRTGQQLAVLVEVDRLKGVLRQTLLCDASRHENSAEHSGHLALMAAVLSEHAGSDVDIARVVRMLLIHDLVEIDAGDTFAYDPSANVGREERERLCADRIFGLLPVDQARELRAPWEEFERQQTVESHFAMALDRLQPLLNNDRANGGSWRAHGVSRSQVRRRMEPIRRAMPISGPW